jgi:glycosyltransferase involved in cell wall biosynthesis
MPTVVSFFGVEPFRIGGTETLARELSRQLGERGWKSVLCFLKEPPEDVRCFLSLPNVSIEVLQDSDGLSFTGARDLARIVRRYSPEILHLYFTGFLGIYPWLARLLGVKQIFFTDQTSRPAGYIPRRAALWKRFSARIINWPITKVVCASRYGLRCLTTLDLLPAERYELVYNAVDLSRVSDKSELAEKFRRRYEIPANRIVIVQVSWIIPEKGIPEVMEVARSLVSKNDNVHFVLVGEGSYREQYMKEAAAMGLSEHIAWTGLIQDPFGEGVYDTADIVCQLSRWEELFGWMIAEAMAYGKPIVATKVGGIPELIDDGMSGFLVERGDARAAADKLDQLACDPNLRNRMGAAGRNIVAEKFDLKHNVAQLMTLYKI